MNLRRGHSQWAACMGNLAMLALLFRHGSDIHRRDSNSVGGWTPFLCTCQKVLLLIALHGNAAGHGSR